MRSKNTLFLNIALISGLLYPAILLAEEGSSGFCLKTCTETYCATSQENYQHCRDLCRGKYDGLIKSCKKSAQEAGFVDEKINNKAKFRPCPLAMKETPSGDGKDQEKQPSSSSDPDTDKAVSDSDTTASEASEKDDTSPQDGEEGGADQESGHEEKAETPSDDDDKSTEEEEA